MSLLKVASYNCRKLPKNNTDLHLRPDIVHLFENYDVILFQETWLAKQELHLCNSLYNNFLACSAAKVDFSKGILQGRPSGGVSLFYRNNIASAVTQIHFPHCDWCVGIQVTINSSCFTLLNVYMPYENCDNDDMYIDNLCILQNIIDGINHSAYAIVGDWNGNMKQTKGVISMCKAQQV